MGKRIQLLLLLLVAQLLLVFVVNRSDDVINSHDDRPLISSEDLARIDSVRVSDDKDNEVEVIKRDGVWGLAQFDGFPARDVDAWLKRVAEMRLGPEIAASEDASQRFVVAANQFKRHIVIAADGQQLASFYLGSAFSRKSTPLRREGEEGIHATSMGIHQANANTSFWLDRGKLRLAADAITAITINDVRLSLNPAAIARAKTESAADAKQGIIKSMAPPAVTIAASDEIGSGQSKEKWLGEDIAPDRRLKPEAVDQLVATVASIEYEDVLGMEARAEYNLEDPPLRIVVSRNDGDDVEYFLGKIADSKEWALKTSLYPQYLKLPDWIGSRLMDQSMSDFLTEAAPTNNAAPLQDAAAHSNAETSAGTTTAGGALADNESDAQGAAAANANAQ